MRRCAALLRRSWSLSGGTAIGGFRRRPQFRLPLLSYADDARRAVPSVVASTFTALSLPRTFSSTSSPSGSSNMHLIKSEEQLNGVLAKIRDESSPAILYFTAAWCGPCRFMSPAIEALNEKYPHVTTYKIDNDQEGIQDKLMELRIDSVPRLHFFSKGQKVDEIVGADIERLKHTMDRLYK
ncbi:thioredoxin O2, mitochondrial-like isoform X1 [Rhodamnia argentea]|uniref:Thioredoxin O2, mitochondrial-like isoform X1 n=1 Tax=Rhodamnia argentea TaxID=178133 RepID=A0ABM3HWA1_9MYRT|nr:thioredoxin O2, mitochondrial-like isoform X1 [Rhodamnia argentea]